MTRIVVHIDALHLDGFTRSDARHLARELPTALTVAMEPAARSEAGSDECAASPRAQTIAGQVAAAIETERER